MTTTYDPADARYVDEADVRHELSRVFGICHGCRQCAELCSSFPSLLSMIDAHPDHDAGRMTPAQQDRVVDECVHSNRCSLNCPYTPERDPAAVDFPRLMLRAEAMRTHTHQRSTRQRIRSALQATPGISSVRLLSPFARRRFTTWFKRRPTVELANPQGRVTFFPTCLVEYQAPAVGQDLIKVCEHNSIECSVATSVGCCGAPWLHSGDVKRFTKMASKNVAVLSDHVRRGTTIVTAQPLCTDVIKRHYADYVGGPDAALVAQHTSDAHDYLTDMHCTPETE